jgi:gamma-glutamyltranspeptidase/glutathione hydrolase
MSPTIVLHSNNSVFLVTGSPGGSQIITTVLHTVVNAIEHQMNVSEVTAAPRFHMQWMPDTLTYERTYGFTTDAMKDLTAMGYNLAGTNSIGDVAAIMRTTAGVITGAHDPRTYYPATTFPLDLDNPMNNPLP